MPKVLIVDDAFFMRMMIRDILKKNGFDVIGEAENGFKAIELYKVERPDIVTMDIAMPGMDGIGAIKIIKESDSTAKIIMCSAIGTPDMVIDAIKAGADDFILKPFQASRVLEAIEKSLR